MVAPNLCSQDVVPISNASQASRIAGLHPEIPATVISIYTGAAALPLHPLMAEMALWRRLIEAVGLSSSYGGLLMRH